MDRGLTSAAINNSIRTPYIEHSGEKKKKFLIEASLYTGFIADGILAEAFSVYFHY